MPSVHGTFARHSVAQAPLLHTLPAGHPPQHAFRSMQPPLQGLNPFTHRLVEQLLSTQAKLPGQDPSPQHPLWEMQVPLHGLRPSTQLPLQG
jgi:hypothetical protein